ncbi:MAG TPA: hypothetical protein VGI93_16930 [Steroidobacteraceae bacterium]|jgi:hypothetical protein
MDGEIDLTGIGETTLIEMYERMDPRYAPKNCARVRQALIALGYLVTDNEQGPGTVEPGPEKLKALTGAAQPFECEARIDWGVILYGSRMTRYVLGRVRTDGVTFEVWADGLIAALGRGETFDCEHIVNVETFRNQIRVEIRRDGATHAVVLQLPGDRDALRLAGILPKTRTADFRSELHGRSQT